MVAASEYPHRVGWAGTGRMGYAIATRLLEAGVDLAVYNRTRAKAEPLAELGAKIVDTPRGLSDRDIVFTMVAGPADVLEVTLGEDGVLSGDARPAVLVDSTTIDPETSAELSAAASERHCGAGHGRDCRPGRSRGSEPERLPGVPQRQRDGVGVHSL